MLTNEVIAATRDAELAPEAAAKRLLARANEGESTDNITVVVVRFDSAESEAREGRNTR
jgi:serine/threonine protein phosphatase PrpC